MPNNHRGSDDPQDLEDRINDFIDGKKVIHIAYLLKQHAVGAFKPSSYMTEWYAFIHYDDEGVNTEERKTVGHVLA